MASEREGGRAREDLELSPSCSSLPLSLLPLLPKATAPLEPLPTRIMAAFFAPSPSPSIPRRMALRCCAGLVRPGPGPQSEHNEQAH